MRRTTITVALVAAILLALLTAGAVLATHTMGPYSEKPAIAGQDGTADTLMGTPGHDFFSGSTGNDTVYGKDGNDFIGRDYQEDRDWGGTDDLDADTYYGGPGKDILDGNGDNSVDTIDCGAGGEDLASFDKGSDDVKTKTCERLDWTDKELKDCAVKPWDNADVQCKTGTKRADNLLGNNDPDILILDTMWGNAGNDTLRARRGFDGLEGGAGNDALYGGAGDDTMYGDGQGDQVKKIDYIDKLYGADGDDRIKAEDEVLVDPQDPQGGTKDGKPDTISCGPGDHDWAVIDSGTDQDPQGVTLTTDEGAQPGEHGQSGCETITTSEDFKSWWGPKKKRGGR
jgi:RTX calcium-binding nonapeptide repeat (4 copies)